MTLYKIKKGIGYIVDLYKTAPLGETMFFIGATEAKLGFHWNDTYEILLGLTGCAGGALLTVIQFRLRNELEKAASRNGYDKEEFSKTLRVACDRQTARVVARRYDFLEDYNALCEVRKKRERRKKRRKNG